MTVEKPSSEPTEEQRTFAADLLEDCAYGRCGGSVGRDYFAAAERIAERDAQAEARVAELEQQLRDCKRELSSLRPDYKEERGYTLRLESKVRELEAAVADANRCELELADIVKRVEAELKTANHWRERHSRDAEAYGIQSNENWKRAKALEEEVARLTPLVADGGALREAVERFVFELDHGTYGGPNEEYVRGGGDQRRRLANKLRAALEQARKAGSDGGGT
jgi:DNA repair exonuclease SbcCD ATPase subunit